MRVFEKLIFPALGAAVALASAHPALAAPPIQDPAAGWDVLWSHVLTDLFVIGVPFFLAAVYWLIKFKAKSPDEVGQGKELKGLTAAGWALFPAAVFMADDFYLSSQGWSLWNIYRRVPENALEVKLTGYQWYWEFDYGNGVVTQELKVPQGQPVVLRMTSPDVVHSFFMPAYRVKEDLMPGRITYLWFLPKKVGTEVATCTEYCGSAHSQMFTTVTTVPAEEFTSWLETTTKQARDVAADKKV